MFVNDMHKNQKLLTLLVRDHVFQKKKSRGFSKMTKKCKAALVCILHSIVHIFIVFHKNGGNVCDTCVLCKYQQDVTVCSGLQVDEVFNQGLQYK